MCTGEGGGGHQEIPPSETSVSESSDSERRAAIALASVERTTYLNRKHSSKLI